MINKLFAEIVHKIAFEYGLTALDVLNLSLTSKHVYFLLFDNLGNENQYDKNKHKSLLGIDRCIENLWWDAAKIAIKTNISDPTVHDNKAIRLAAKYGNTDIVEILLQDDRVNPSALNNYAMYQACINSRHEILDLIVNDKRFDDSTLGTIYQSMSIAKNNHRIIKSFLTSNITFGYHHLVHHCFPPIFIANIRRCNLDIVKIIMENRNCSVYINENDFCIGIQEAIYYGHIDIVEYLLNLGIVSYTYEDNIFLSVAINHKKFDMIKLLLSNNQVYNMLTNTRETKLYRFDDDIQDFFNENYPELKLVIISKNNVSYFYFTK